MMLKPGLRCHIYMRVQTSISWLPGKLLCSGLIQPTSSISLWCGLKLSHKRHFCKQIMTPGQTSSNDSIKRKINYWLPIQLRLAALIDVQRDSVWSRQQFWKIFPWSVIAHSKSFNSQARITVMSIFEVSAVSADGLAPLSIWHYDDVIISAMASRITSLTIVHSRVYSGADQRKHQSSASPAFVRGIDRWPVNSPYKGPVTRKMFPFDDIIMEHLQTQWRLRSGPIDVRDLTWRVNSLAPGNFEWYFICVIFKRILVIDGWGISVEIALIWMSLDFTDDQSTLVQVMAWCRQATSHYLSHCWPRSL